MTRILEHFNPDAMVAEDLGPLARNLLRLASYCAYRRNAMRFRAAGNILEAQVAEQRCEEIYARLPEGWRW